jgi:acetyltransferase
MLAHPLDPLLRPHCVALVGASATPGSVGRVLLDNLLAGGFEGPVFAVNPKRFDTGRATWVASVGDLPATADLAIVATPAAAVPSVVRALGEAGTRVAVIVSGGLTAENGLREAMLKAANPFGMRLVGPNCLGIVMPHAGLNAAFARNRAAPGHLGLISQSGALVTAMLDWAQARDLGFSGIVSGGDMADVDLADLIGLFASDPQTKAIALYIEGVGDGGKFVTAARTASRHKPLVAIKAGRSPAAFEAVRSHTGALMGSAEIYEAAFRRAGIVQVRSLLDLFDAAETLCLSPAPRGNRLAIVGNGGGSAILAVDAMPAGASCLATLSDEVIAALDDVLPPIWSRANPVDLIGDATPARYRAAVRAVLADPKVDGLLVLHCPTAVADGAGVARAVADTVAEGAGGRPVLACWLGETNGRAAAPILAAAGIPVFESPEDAVEGFDYLLARRAAAASRPPTSRAGREGAPDAHHIVEKCLAEGREWLDEIEGKQLLETYGIPTAPTRFGRTAEDVQAAASEISPPYAVKIVSPDILHKSDAGGVSLGLATAKAAAEAARAMLRRMKASLPEARLRGFAIETMVTPTHGHELIVGLKRDPAFGPVVIAGAGGIAVEVLNDKAVELAPVDAALAREMIGRTRISRLLAGFRGTPAADVEALCRAIAAVSDLALDVPEILELDINPLVVDPNGVCALDTRIRLRCRPGEGPGPATT